MLIRFRVQNFLSFKEEIEFSMLPGRTRQHPGHFVPGLQAPAGDLLKAGVIYGPNASGKSNLVQAIAFAQEMVIHGRRLKQATGITPFKLDPSWAGQPSRFEFELRTVDYKLPSRTRYGPNSERKVEYQDYLYGFELDGQRIHSEWLYQLGKTSQALLFERTTNLEGQTRVEFGKLNLPAKKQEEYLEFVAMGVRPNQLFLTESVDRQVQIFSYIYHWFDSTLVVMFPDTATPLDMAGEQPGYINAEVLVKYLQEFDTGICGYELKPLDAAGDQARQLLALIDREGELPVEGGASSIAMLSGERYFLIREAGQSLRIYHLLLKHKSHDCQEVAFETSEESDGTLRLLDLIPFLDPERKEPRVLIIDEFDRSLHPGICYRFLELFLAEAGAPRQLVVTTHESNLLSFDLLRRDEIWFVEKDSSGASKVYSLEEFTPRYDKDIQKGYLLGRFGAIPVLGPVDLER